MPPTEAPSWLKEKVYEPKRQRTVDLVRQAVDALVKEQQKVSLASVSRKSKEMDPEGRGVSESAILNNPDAKAYYSRHKSWKGAPSHKSTGGGRTGAPVQRPIDPNRDTARVRQRLMRKGKDELANRVLELEQGSAVQDEQWLRLNDDLLQLRLRAEKAEAQVEKTRRALDAKDAQIRDFQKRVNGLYTAGSGVTDEEIHRPLQEALKRAQEAEEQAKDLRLRLFAKKVVRMRDKVRHLDPHSAHRMFADVSVAG
ncbi:MAG TPA: hypothetical protein VGK74_21700 [Symbiobacteriaceae bacterium]|jgi:hypothetical protein